MLGLSAIQCNRCGGIYPTFVDYADHRVNSPCGQAAADGLPSHPRHLDAPSHHPTPETFSSGLLACVVAYLQAQGWTVEPPATGTSAP